MSERTPEDFEAAPIDAAGYVDFGPVKRMREAERMQATFDRITHRATMARARSLAAAKYSYRETWGEIDRLGGKVEIGVQG